MGGRLLTFVGAVLMLLGVSAAAPTSGMMSEEAVLLARLNAVRQQVGAPPLMIEPVVAGLARERADDMARRRYFSHTTPEGQTVLTLLPARGVPFAWAGETLQRNNYAGDRTVGEAERALLASPAHRAILLDARFRHVGLGHAADGALHYYAVILIDR